MAPDTHPKLNCSFNKKALWHHLTTTEQLMSFFVLFQEKRGVFGGDIFSGWIISLSSGVLGDF
jgi:hypothetical protein